MNVLRTQRVKKKKAGAAALSKRQSPCRATKPSLECPLTQTQGCPAATTCTCPRRAAAAAAAAPEAKTTKSTMKTSPCPNR